MGKDSGDGRSKTIPLEETLSETLGRYMSFHVYNKGSELLKKIFQVPLPKNGVEILFSSPPPKDRSARELEEQ